MSVHYEDKRLTFLTQLSQPTKVLIQPVRGNQELHLVLKIQKALETHVLHECNMTNYVLMYHLLYCSRTNCGWVYHDLSGSNLEGLLP